ncbi:N-carbamoylputrescine amidase [Ancylobacter defluvii]|uniref:N-carbamoylputrescine amidohydrolase n=1 Tax=Ancylobacter defluvii TaxID=1282440 RepID=A0A9W6NC57_9HYPH|nr:N-carbamoylputrescine amidase [Ancylobacter defluvii]MBS7587134.1 N-carbamoylputrescine amidase [Ancylobacter defluvii]GLK85438.1 N-carbamoylputrescine amidohydrolase [Ancylobacter defluvii]
MRLLTLAATQMRCDWDIPGNIARAERLVREAAAGGAKLILLQELFETPYFCQDQLHEFLDLAAPFEGNRLIAHFAALAAELGVVLPLSFFERAGPAAYNSLAMIDADGTVMGVYRKSHIPDGPGYTEKFYFSPGDTGFKVWDTAVGRIGVGICWDQWFPESARVMALMGAEVLLYPTAIGSEPQDPGLDSAAHWQRVMQGHAGANLMPLLASNRIGSEPGRNGTEITFYGSSFIAGPTGEKVAEAGRSDETVLLASFDLDAIAHQRRSWGVFRDRRPELYAPLLTLDGKTSPR